MTQHTNDDSDGALPIGVAYTAGQLVQSLRAAAAHTGPNERAKAEARAKGLLSVLENLVSGALRVGQRQPYADTPTWVTPEVMRGGFASGAHAAGGELRAHERALAERLGAVTASRTALNGHHLARAGLAELAGQLESRRYRIEVPEEGALLAVRWLIARGEHAVAASLIETIEPFFDRLRFYPRPGETPLAEPVVGLETPVLARSARSLAEGLAKKEPSKDVEAMREHYEVWAPLTDAMVALVLETIVGETPRFEGEGSARHVVGGMPFTRVPEGFEARRVALLAAVTSARAQHTRCQRVHRESELLGLLTDALAALPRLDETARASFARRVRHRLAGFVTAHGAPGSSEHRALRASQVAGPSHARLAHVLAERLTALTEPGEGLTAATAEAATRPITLAEQRNTVPAGSMLPAHLTARLVAVEEAPLAALLRRGAIGSGEVLATLLPQLTGPALATRFTDASARTLYAASYRAFRQRRSLLLLWLQHQVRFSELPWIAALEASADADPLPAVEETLRQLACVAIAAFPDTITPNKLVSELASLAKVARPTPTGTHTGIQTGTPTGIQTGTHTGIQTGMPTGIQTGTPTGIQTGTQSQTGRQGGAAEETRPWLPLVEEVASDIFMGTFSVKYLRAAQVAARVFRAMPAADAGPSLYERYYAIEGARVLAMERLEEKWGVRTCPDFDAYCLELAALPAGGNPRARGGAMIEQASILTTHNLAVLVDGLALAPRLREQWAELAMRAFVSVLDRLERRVIPEGIPRIQRMRASKTLAFGWRQAIFFLSWLEPAAQAAFLAKARETLEARTPLARERFAPVFTGLARAAAGHVLPREATHREVDGARRLLGWTVETPFLMGVARAGTR